MVWPRPAQTSSGAVVGTGTQGRAGSASSYQRGAGADTAPVSQPLPNSTNLQKAEINQSLLYRGPVDPANWFGVRKGYPNLGYIQVRAGPRRQVGWD